MSYPPDFQEWPQEKKNQHFADEAAAYRETRRKANGGGAAAAEHGPGGDQASERPAKHFDAGAAPVWAVSLVPASSISPEPVSWLWTGWLARGKQLGIIAGQPGGGKTTLAMKMAAAVSGGGRWPDQTTAKQGNVVIWSGEDDAADTLVPRLEASGADLRHVFFAGTMTRGKESRPFDPAKDIAALQVAISAAGGAALIVVDPIVSATAADSHKNSETRRGLQPLVDMAAQLNASLIRITHFTMGSEGKSPIDRVTGSVAFGVLARIVMVAARDQTGENGKPGRRILMRAKSNIGPDDGRFAYNLALVPMLEHPDIIASVATWEEAIEGNARDVLAASETIVDDDKRGDLEEAKDFLRCFLTCWKQLQKDVKEAADAHGIPGRR